MKKNLSGGILWLVTIPVVGYLLCSLFSWNFHISEWNTFSNIVKWLLIVFWVITLKDVIVVALGKDE